MWLRIYFENQKKKCSFEHQKSALLQLGQLYHAISCYIQVALLGHDLFSGFNAHPHVRNQGIILCRADLRLANHEPLAARPSLVSLEAR